MHNSELLNIVSGIIGLLVIAAGIRALAKWSRIPFTVLLVLTGMGLVQLAEWLPSLLQPFTEIPLSSDIILLIFLPTLVFEAAFNLDSRQLKENLAPILLLAVPGVLLSTFLLGGIIWGFNHYMLHYELNFLTALLIGAVLSATDPVAVVALFQQLGAPKRLTTLIEGESLFNDATTIVVTRLIVGIIVGSLASEDMVLHGTLHGLMVFSGGIAVGWLAALLFGTVLGKVNSDPFIEMQLTLVLAYAAFLLAETLFHVSGVMATVAAGITMGGWGRSKISPSVSEQLSNLWLYLSFVANALIFLLLGLHINFTAMTGHWLLLAVVIGALLMSRLVVVYGLMSLVSLLPNIEKIKLNYQTLLYWGGLRGAVVVALALSLPSDNPLIPRDVILVLVFGVVLFTLLVQGLTMEPLVKWLNLDQQRLGDRLAQTEGGLTVVRQALQRIPELQAGGLFSARIANSLQQRYQNEENKLHHDLETLRDTEVNHTEARRLLYLRCFATEKSTYYDLYSKGHLSESAYRDLSHGVGLQIDSMRHTNELAKDTFQILFSQRLERGLLRLFDRFSGFKEMLEKLSLARTARDYEKSWGQFQGSGKVLEEIDDIAIAESVTGDVLEEVRQMYQKWRAGAEKRLDDTAEQFPEFVNAMQERLAKRTLLLSQREAIATQRESGMLPIGVAEAMLHDIEQELSNLRGYVVNELKVDPSELLRKVPFFHNTPEAEFAKVAEQLRSLTVPPNDYIIRQGETGSSMYLIARGVVRITRKDENGTLHNLATLMAGDFFGEMALLHSEPRNANCRAVTPCALYELRRDAFDKVKAVCPAIQEAIEAADRGRSGKQ